MYVEFLTYYKANHKTIEQFFFDKGDCIKLDNTEATLLMQKGVVKPVFDDEPVFSGAA
ncbi:MAG: hypothetical protein U1E36_00975 [Rickettsiales bacterium]